MKVLSLTAALAVLAMVAAPVLASEPTQYAPPSQYAPQAEQLPQGVEPPPGPGHWAQAPEGWVWVPDYVDDYAYVDPGYDQAYVYAPGYYYWAGGRWVWRVARWAVRDYYRDRYWDNTWPHAHYYGYRAAPRTRYYGYGARTWSPARRYLRYDYWRDNRPLVDR